MGTRPQECEMHMAEWLKFLYTFAWTLMYLCDSHIITVLSTDNITSKSYGNDANNTESPGTSRS